MTTTMAPSQAAISEASLDKFLAVRDEPSWLVERRRAAMTSFQSAGWPSLRDEEWRRTDVRALKLGGFDLVPSAAPSSEAVSAFAPAFDQMAESYGTGLLHLDGHAAREVRPAPLPDGVIFTTLAQAVKDHPELLKEHLLTRAVRPDEDVFSAYHAAFWSSGVLLYVPKGVKLEAPLFHLMGLSAAGSVDFNHTLVILEEGAEATLVQESAGRDRADAPALHAGAIELIVGPRARLRFVNIQNWDRGTWHFSRERAILDRDATIQWTVGGLGSRLAKVNQEVKLAGEGAKAQVNGVMFTTGRQNLTYLTRQDHAAPHTTSDLLYKAGLADSSRVVWKGMIRVEPDAQKTNAYQKNDNLMMSDEARSDSIPGLEIEANDVRCTHGATAGRVDEEMIFYLRSRGIKRDEAVRLIIEGFFANVYDRISVEPVRETLRQAVADKLEI